MKPTTLGICLFALASLAPLHAQQCKVAGSGISAVPGGYAVTLPSAARSAVPTNQGPLRLVLRDQAGNASSVAGPVRVLSTGQLWIQTSEQLTISPQRCPVEAVLQAASIADFGCLPAEFGIGCFLTWCAGQTYCLPGPGPGGMQCVCL